VCVCGCVCVCGVCVCGCVCVCVGVCVCGVCVCVCVLEGGCGSDRGLRTAALKTNFLISELTQRTCQILSPYHHQLNFVRFEIRMVVTIMITVRRNVTPCSLLDLQRHFRKICHLLRKGK